MGAAEKRTGKEDALPVPLIRGFADAPQIGINMPFNKEEDLKIKYAYVDGENEAPRGKKSKRKAPKKANHKHNYQNIIVEYTYPENYPVRRLAGQPTQAIESYCTECGRMNYAQRDKTAEELFPHIHTGYFGFLRTLGHDKHVLEQEEKDYRAYCNKNYPHIIIDDYIEDWSKGGQRFINLDDIFYQGE